MIAHNVIGLAFIATLVLIVIYNIKMAKMSASAYERLTQYGAELMQDESIPESKRREIRSQIISAGKPGWKYLFLLLSPFVGFFIRPTRKQRKHRKVACPAWQIKFDKLYGDAVIFDGPLIFLLAVLISLLSIAVVYFVVIVALAFNINTSVHVDKFIPKKLSSPQSTISRVVDIVSHRTFAY